MKKLVSIILVIVLTFTLSGCDEDSAYKECRDNGGTYILADLSCDYSDVESYTQEEVDALIADLQANDLIVYQQEYWDNPDWAKFNIYFFKNNLREDYIVAKVTTNEEDSTFNLTWYAYEDMQLIGTWEEEVDEYELKEDDKTLYQTLYDRFNDDVESNNMLYQDVYNMIYDDLVTNVE